MYIGSPVRVHLFLALFFSQDPFELGCCYRTILVFRTPESRIGLQCKQPGPTQNIWRIF